MLRGLSSAPFWLVQYLLFYTSLQFLGNLLHPHTRVYRTHRRIRNQTLSFLLDTLQLFPTISSSPSHFGCSLPGTAHAQPELGGSTLLLSYCSLSPLSSVCTFLFQKRLLAPPPESLAYWSNPTFAPPAAPLINSRLYPHRMGIHTTLLGLMMADPRHTSQC